MTQCL